MTIWIIYAGRYLYFQADKEDLKVLNYFKESQRTLDSLLMYTFCVVTIFDISQNCMNVWSNDTGIFRSKTSSSLKELLDVSYLNSSIKPSIMNMGYWRWLHSFRKLCGCNGNDEFPAFPRLTWSKTGKCKRNKQLNYLHHYIRTFVFFNEVENCLFLLTIAIWKRNIFFEKSRIIDQRLEIYKIVR